MAFVVVVYALPRSSTEGGAAFVVVASAPLSLWGEGGVASSTEGGAAFVVVVVVASDPRRSLRGGGLAFVVIVASL